MCPLSLVVTSSEKFDLAMKLKCDELKKQGGGSKHVNKITENNLIQAFAV